MDVLGELEGLVAEIPENIGKALAFLGTKIDELGVKLEELAAKMDKTDHDPS